MGGGAPGLDLVGACGFRRGETMVRAAGEAVERLALVPPDPDPDRVRGVPPDHRRRVKIGTPGVSRAAPAIDQAVADCLPAVDLSQGPEGGHTVLLPTAVVDDPCPDFDPQLVDPSPSAAAAGTSWNYAVERALLESIERDAVLTAWALKPSVPWLDPGDPPVRWRASAAGDTLERVGEVLAEDADLTARTVIIPTGVPRVSCALTLLFDRHGPTAAGAAAHWSTTSAVATSAREALQVMVVLRNVGAEGRQLGRVEVVDEMSRATYWAHPASATEPRRWLEACVRREPSDGAALDLPTEEARLGHLTRRLAGDGLTPMVCDLTARLPRVIQGLGWVAVRAVVLGHQALPMDERHDWSWVRPRLHQAAARWGISAVTADHRYQGEAGPHPLI
jgi:ribosomal protein S12 methylthiotransferase accessory factor